MSFTNCKNNPAGADINEIDKVLIFLEENYPEFELMDSSFVNNNIKSPYTEFTQHFQKGKESDYPFIFRYDFNSDRYDDYIVNIYRTYPLNDSKYDSVFESKSILIFGANDGTLIPANEEIAYRGSVFSGVINPKVRHRYGIVEPGKYKRGYPFNDFIELSTNGVGVYNNLAVGVTEWFSMDSSKSTPIYLD
ncbi:MAG: hypothetical protein WD059_11345 [Balneolaceae bacterium]